jgi:hypothetical protein
LRGVSVKMGYRGIIKMILRNLLRIDDFWGFGVFSILVRVIIPGSSMGVDARIRK